MIFSYLKRINPNEYIWFQALTITEILNQDKWT